MNLQTCLLMLSIASVAPAQLFGQPATDKSAPAAAARPLAGMGIMVGEVSDHSALVQVRLTETDKLVDGDVAGAPGFVKFVLRATKGKPGRPAVEQTAAAAPERDFIARVSFEKLTPGTLYVCETFIGTSAATMQPGPIAEFKTQPGKDAADPVRFAVVTGMWYEGFHRQQPSKVNNADSSGAIREDKSFGYPALKTILSMQPDFFVGTGDNIYYDKPKKPRAQSVEEMRQKWHEQFVQPHFLELFAKVPTFWMVDDHDYRIDDCDNTGEYRPLPKAAQRIAMEQLPFAPAKLQTAKTYRTHRVSKDLQLWFTENRFYRSPNSDPDGPDKSIWGKEQKQWLKDTLLASDATFRILVSPTPMVGPDDLRKTDNHCNIGGFQHERDDFFKFLKENGLDQGNFFIVCGDRHWQYHAVDSTGVEEFSCGALVDANSRLGRLPGDPAGTDPDRLIKHLHEQTKPSGGFLMITSEPSDDSTPAQLKLEFFDERGESLYTDTKLQK